MNESDEGNIKDLFSYWDHKLTIFVIAVTIFVAWFVMHDQIYLDDDSVYVREGYINEVVSCAGGLNSKSIVVRDSEGNMMVWGGNSCDGVKDRLERSPYKAYFSERLKPEDPIYLEINGDVKFEPGFERTEFGFVLLVSGFVSFFGSLFVLKRRRRRAEG